MALQPLSPQDQALFLAALRGEHLVQGLRNRDLAERLYGPRPQEPKERRRRGARVTRLIQLLRARTACWPKCPCAALPRDGARA